MHPSSTPPWWDAGRWEDRAGAVAGLWGMQREDAQARLSPRIPAPHSLDCWWQLQHENPNSTFQPESSQTPLSVFRHPAPLTRTGLQLSFVSC